MRVENHYIQTIGLVKESRLKHPCLLLLSLCLLLVSCKSQSERELYQKVSNTSIDNSTQQAIASTVINEYCEAEKAINRRYVNEVTSILNHDFDKQLETFQGKELGLFNSYKHMFKVLIDNKHDLNDYWKLKKEKYFSSIKTRQELHDCYESYSHDVLCLRNQICRTSKDSFIPKEHRYDIKEQEISLEIMNLHSYNNLAIEFGVDIAIWLLSMGIVAVFSLLIGCVAPPAWVLTLLSIVASVVLSIYNDRSVINSIRSQYQEQIALDSTDIIKELNQSTINFYECLSK